MHRMSVISQMHEGLVITKSALRLPAWAFPSAPFLRPFCARRRPSAAYLLVDVSAYHANAPRDDAELVGSCHARGLQRRSEARCEAPPERWKVLREESRNGRQELWLLLLLVAIGSRTDQWHWSRWNCCRRAAWGPSSSNRSGGDCRADPSAALIAACCGAAPAVKVHGGLLHSSTAPTLRSGGMLRRPQSDLASAVCNPTTRPRHGEWRLRISANATRGGGSANSASSGSGEGSTGSGSGRRR